MSYKLEHPEHCFYSDNEAVIIDFARPDGRSCCYGQSLDEMRERYPDAELLPYTEASVKYDAAVRRKIMHPPVEITEERFNYMLEVLPPTRWTRRKDSESFVMSETICGTLADAYVRIGNRYFEVPVDTKTHNHDDLVWCLQNDSRFKES
jgi:hypothetical protein